MSDSNPTSVSRETTEERIEEPAQRHQSSPRFTGMHRYIRLASVLLLVLVLGVVAGMLVERNIARSPQNVQSQFRNLETVTDILEDQYYYRPLDPTAKSEWEDGLEQQAIGGMLGSLEDTHTQFLEPDDAQSAANQLAGSYEGVGIIFELDTRIVITSVVAGGPADLAGIKRGDILTSVDGRIVAPADDIRSMIQGPSGTTVMLDIQRAGAVEPLKIDVVRGKIVTPPVSFAMIPNTSIGLIRIDLFGDQTTVLVSQFLDDAQEQGATGIVLDLRGNGGGWVKSAQEVIGRFVPSDLGPALYEDTTSAEGGEQPLAIDNGSGAVYTGPVIVLVDELTASAAEIVAGSLQDYDRALVVGRQTYGKGSVQRIYDFKDGSSMRVTIAEWLTPSRNRIQDVGIAPNIAVSTESHATSETDADLEQAVALFKAGQSRPTDPPRQPAASPASSPAASPAA